MFRLPRMHSSVLVAVSAVLVGAHPLRADTVKPRKSGSHEFDFEFGTWQTHLKRRLRPLSGSNVWVEYDGTTSDQPIWHGQANLVQLEADGPSGHIEALSLRLYREDTNQWSLNFANSTVGTTSTPSIGTIQDGRGEFIDQETFGTRVILVRFIITRISSTACHFEQSFSEDGGKSWEVNWIADDRLIARPASRSVGFSIAAAAAVVFASLLTQPVHAQRAEDNAISAAQDAFGTSVGLQSIGLYSPTSARGFNPTQAGNLRIDGLYFDQQTASNNLALFSGSDMRVGMAAQSYAFPAPTGIADYKLRIPGDHPILSMVMTRGPFDEATVQVDTEYPLIRDTLSASLSVLDYENFDYQAAKRSREYATAVLMRYGPVEEVEIVPFFGYIGGGEHGELPYVYADGVNPPPVFQELTLPVQNWSSWGWGQTTTGVIVKSHPRDNWSVAVGLFRSAESDPQNFNDLFIGLMPNRTADHVMDVVPPLNSHSNSGELQVAHEMMDGSRQRQLALTIRARQADREFGGDSLTNFGSTSIDNNATVRELPLSFSSVAHDRTRQVGAGINYTERWMNAGSFALGVLKTRYGRSVMDESDDSIPQRASPWLPAASFSVAVDGGMTVYASYIRGLEDSVNAPTNAINRGEPPPATASWQFDGGARYTTGGRVQLLLGYFEIRKPYFNLDLNHDYRQLGDVRNEGIEGSATMSGTGGLRIVSGFVKITPEVQRRISVQGGAGVVPLGPVPLTMNVNADYMPTVWRGWAASLQWTWLSSRVETEDNRYKLPPLSTANVGARYTRKLFNRECSLRFDVSNITPRVRQFRRFTWCFRNCAETTW